VLALFAQRAQEGVEAGRPGIVGRARQHPAGADVMPDFGALVGVVLGVFHAGGHIHDLAHRGVAIGRVGKFGDIFRHQCIVVEAAFRNQHRAERAEERLGDGHRHVGGVRAHHAEVTLVDNPPPVQHDDRVGVVGLQRLCPAHPVGAAERLERQGIDVIAFGA
jgi:hypothetical protein